MNTEGLLLLTNNGELKRFLGFKCEILLNLTEHPSSSFERTYRVRIYGAPSDSQLHDLLNGIEVDGIMYKPVFTQVEKSEGKNVWLQMTLTEGKNREIRKICEFFNWNVNRIVRIQYGPYTLDNQLPGSIKEVPLIGSLKDRFNSSVIIS